jgi:hypothetical protein
MSGAAQRKGPASAPTLPSNGSTDPCKEMAMNGNTDITTATQNSSVILALADLAAHAEAVNLEADNRSIQMVTLKNARAEEFFTDRMNRAHDDRMAFLEAITRIKAGSVQEAGAQLVAAVNFFDMVDCEFPEEDRRLYAMFEAIGRVLFSVGEAIEAEHGRIAGGGFDQMTVSPWVGVLDDQGKERAA